MCNGTASAITIPRLQATADELESRVSGLAADAGSAFWVLHHEVHGLSDDDATRHLETSGGSQLMRTLIRIQHTLADVTHGI
jgi:hypothetical protein